MLVDVASFSLEICILNLRYLDFKSYIERLLDCQVKWVHRPGRGDEPLSRTHSTLTPDLYEPDTHTHTTLHQNKVADRQHLRINLIIEEFECRTSLMFL